MIFRNLDSDGDWAFGKGINDYLFDDEAISLNIRTLLLSWVGDCFFDINAGIDWYNRLGKTNQASLLGADIKRVILLAYGVTSINSIDFDIIDRDFNISFNINTLFSKEYQDSIRIGLND